MKRGLFHTWREDEWFRTVLNAFHSASTMPETTNQSLIVLQNFMMDSLRNDLYVWEVHPRLNPTSEFPRRDVPPPRTPTDDAGPSPNGLLGVPVQQTMTQPGLPTPRADVSSQQPLTQQGNAVNQGQNMGGLGINIGAGHCAQGGGMSDAVV